jgi:hypothetical protein
LRGSKINLSKFRQKFKILPEVLDIIVLVEEQSGKEIEFLLGEDLYVDSLVKMARTNMPRHVLKIKADQGRYISEAIAHECGHILRLLRVSPADRKVSYSSSSHFTKAFAELDDEKSSLPSELKNQMYNTWINGLVLQVNNLPVDVRIERWIYNTYPGLREEQAQYLRNQALACVSAFSKELTKVTSPKVFRCNRSMVYAYLKAISLLIGGDIIQHFDSHPEIVEVGEWLFKFLDCPDLGYLQDIETTNEWAKFLGLTDWFSWTDFENVPVEYCD